MKEITFTERLKMKLLYEVLAFIQSFSKPPICFDCEKILEVCTSVFLFLDLDASMPTCLSLSLLRWFNPRRPGNVCISYVMVTQGGVPRTQQQVWQVPRTCCELRQTNFWVADASSFDSSCFLLQGRAARLAAGSRELRSGRRGSEAESQSLAQHSSG